MQLAEPLQICLLALESRHPDHFVDMNEIVLGPQFVETKSWKVQEIIHFLKGSTLLQAPALLVIDQQQNAIYLLDYSDKIPAMVIHCQGRVLSTYNR